MTQVPAPQKRAELKRSKQNFCLLEIQRKAAQSHGAEGPFRAEQSMHAAGNGGFCAGVLHCAVVLPSSLGSL